MAKHRFPRSFCLKNSIWFSVTLYFALRSSLGDTGPNSAFRLHVSCLPCALDALHKPSENPLVSFREQTPDGPLAQSLVACQRPGRAEAPLATPGTPALGAIFAGAAGVGGRDSVHGGCSSLLAPHGGRDAGSTPAPSPVCPARRQCGGCWPTGPAGCL